ncbi:MFS transporter [Streptacidiphilus sp. 4-A2]|nr:MFS transporter [Streptacidiphilus sp. 4-A2]
MSTARRRPGPAVRGVALALRRATGARTVPALGGALLAAGYAALVLAHHAIWQLVLLNAVLGLGTGLVLSSLPGLILDVSPADRTGIATGVYSTAKTLGGSIGSAAFAAILSSLTIRNTAVPTQSAYTTVWWLCAAASLGVTLAACVLLRHDAAPLPVEPAPAPASAPTV